MVHYSVRASPKMLVQTCKFASFGFGLPANLHLANLHLSWCPSQQLLRPTLSLCHFGGCSKLHVGIDSFYEVLVFLKVCQNSQICWMLKSANVQICRILPARQNQNWQEICTFALHYHVWFARTLFEICIDLTGPIPHVYLRSKG